MKVAKIMQITTKEGIHIQIGVDSKEDYFAKRQRFIESQSEYVDVIETCTVKKSEVALIEYFEKQEGDE